MTFLMPSGFRVSAVPVAVRVMEFTTSNADGDVVSTVRKAGEEARSTLATLAARGRIDTALR